MFVVTYQLEGFTGTVYKSLALYGCNPGYSVNYTGTFAKMTLISASTLLVKMELVTTPLDCSCASVKKVTLALNAKKTLMNPHLTLPYGVNRRICQEDGQCSYSEPT